MNHHPTLLTRFGLVMGVMANRDLIAGEEVFVSYNYNIGKAPDWYQVRWGTGGTEGGIWQLY